MTPDKDQRQSPASEAPIPGRLPLLLLFPPPSVPTPFPPCGYRCLCLSFLCNVVSCSLFSFYSIPLLADHHILCPALTFFLWSCLLFSPLALSCLLPWLATPHQPLLPKPQRSDLRLAPGGSSNRCLVTRAPFNRGGSQAG